uniref:Uncharacterized protein n=1 Tax=Arundo donax TaxID=35708 RepID=A0A0A9AHN2_ARUDO
MVTTHTLSSSSIDNQPKELQIMWTLGQHEWKNDATIVLNCSLPHAM